MVLKVTPYAPPPPEVCKSPIGETLSLLFSSAVRTFTHFLGRGFKKCENVHMGDPYIFKVQVKVVETDI